MQQSLSKLFSKYFLLSLWALPLFFNSCVWFAEELATFEITVEHPEDIEEIYLGRVDGPYHTCVRWGDTVSGKDCASGKCTTTLKTDGCSGTIGDELWLSIKYKCNNNNLPHTFCGYLDSDKEAIKVTMDGNELIDQPVDDWNRWLDKPATSARASTYSGLQTAWLGDATLYTNAHNNNFASYYILKENMKLAITGRPRIVHVNEIRLQKEKGYVYIDATETDADLPLVYESSYTYEKYYEPNLCGEIDYKMLVCKTNTEVILDATVDKGYKVPSQFRLDGEPLVKDNEASAAEFGDQYFVSKPFFTAAESGKVMTLTSNSRMEIADIFRGKQLVSTKVAYARLPDVETEHTASLSFGRDSNYFTFTWDEKSWSGRQTMITDNATYLAIRSEHDRGSTPSIFTSMFGTLIYDGTSDSYTATIQSDGKREEFEEFKGGYIVTFKAVR